MNRIYVIIAGSDSKTIAAIRDHLTTIEKVTSDCDVELVLSPTPKELLKAILKKALQTKVIAIMQEDIIPRFENSDFESRPVHHSYMNTVLPALQSTPELQALVSSILVYCFQGLDADETTKLLNDHGNFSLVAGSFGTRQDDPEWRHLKSAIMKAIRKFTETQQDNPFSGLKDQMIGHSKTMRDVFSFIDAVAKVDLTVLIQGETGVGKELVARQIHDQSNRSKGPFVTVNCGAIVDGLFESELFGHEKGAFTGAVSQNKGKFEMADGGSIFLDEIGELPKNQQVKMLRVLETHTITRVGSSKEIPVNVRVIAATNKPLDAAVKANEFREDLFYRISGLQTYLPPLCERPKDIPPLVNHFLNQLNEEAKVRKSFDKEVLETLQNYSWPGNVRELRNIVEGAFSLSPSNRIPSSPAAQKLLDTLKSSNHKTLNPREQSERDTYQFALIRNEGNRRKTASELGVDVKTLRKKIKKYKLNMPR